MFNWLSQNSQALTVLASIGNLIVWLVYAQLLYLGFHRQRHPRLVINRGKRKDTNALCIISNMSKEPIFIEYIIAELKTSEGTVTLDVTELSKEYSDEGEGSEEQQKSASLSDSTRQGPLDSGGFLHIGSFGDVIKRLASQGNVELEGYRPKGDLVFLSLNIQLICKYGPEDSPFAAERSFDLRKHEQYGTLTPMSWNTKQSDSLIQRRRLAKKLARLEETNFQSSETFNTRKS